MSEIILIFFKQLPGKKSLTPAGWGIQAKLEIYFWLGLQKNNRDFLIGLPNGYTTIRNNPTLPPTSIKYTGSYLFLNEL